MTAPLPGPVRPGLAESVRIFEERMRPLVEEGAPYAIVGFPDHNNIGDAAIYAGQMAFMNAFARRGPDYVCATDNYRADIGSFCPEGTIYIVGGGNFGDLWQYHHRLRLDVIGRYPTRKVVQFPQSIHFGNPAGIEETRRVIAGHPAFTLLVRDEESLDFARRHLDCEVLLAPDGAVNLRSLEANAPPSDTLLSLLRRDKEKSWTEAEELLSGFGPVEDWPPLPRYRRALLRRIERVLSAAAQAAQSPMKLRIARYDAQIARLLEIGVEILGRGRYVVTDRLHAHLLSCLLGKEHVVLDNSYGKITRYIAAWGDHGLTRVAGDMEALTSELKRLVPGAGTQENPSKSHALGRG